MRRHDGEILERMRKDGGFSRRYVAEKCGISMTTIKNWESGVSVPNITQLFEYCEAIDRAPTEVVLYMMHPELMGNEASDDVVDRAITARVPYLSALEKKDLLFICSARHGGDRTAFLQEAIAALQLPMAMRSMIAELVSSAYKTTAAAGALSYPDDIQPDIRILDEAIGQGFAAAFDGKKAYIAQTGEGTL